MKAILNLCLFLASFSAFAFQPRTGQWWDPSESGRGFNVEIQNGVMTLTMYTYDATGNAQWYLAAGNMTGGQHSFSGTLDKYRGGQCVSCSYRPATTAGNDGTVTVNFASEVAATVLLPDGHVTAIVPLNFGYGAIPNAMLGEWVFVEDILSVSFADRFNFTQMGVGNGNAIAIDAVKRAGCEQGDTPATVTCVDINSAGALENGYTFVYGLDETFNGQWIAPSGNVYPMKGMRTSSPNGGAKSSTKDDQLLAAKLASDRSDAGAIRASPEQMAALLSIAAHIHAALQ